MTDTLRQTANSRPPSDGSADSVEVSDQTLVDFLRGRGSATIGDLVHFSGVTQTAVRQRLTRLMARGLVERTVASAGRGRPSHRYSLTAAGHRSGGTNYDQLAQVLWEEIRGVADPAVRQGLLQRISLRLTELYRDQVHGGSLEERMASLAGFMRRQEVAFESGGREHLPVLTALACPYPDLAERDRSICAMEKLLFSEVLGERLKLTACRLDGAGCCTFEASSASGA